MPRRDRATLDLTQIVPPGTGASETTRARAAEIVEGFVHEQAVPALEGVIKAAQPRVAADQAAAARRASEIVDREVARFRGLERR